MGRHAATSGRRVYSIVGALRAANDATVVPHEPPPITATHVSLLTSAVTLAEASRSASPSLRQKNWEHPELRPHH